MADEGMKYGIRIKTSLNSVEIEVFESVADRAVESFEKALEAIAKRDKVVAKKSPQSFQG